MSDKTISERLREWAYEGSKETLTDVGAMLNCLGTGWRGIFHAIADEVDAEKDALIDANKDSAHHSMRLWAEKNGMPMLEEGEAIGEWLDRWFVNLPCDSKGEPVRFRNEYEYDGNPYTARKMVLYENGSVTVCDMSGNGHNYAPGERVERHVKVLDADGVEINVGDEGWSNYGSFKKRVIKAVHPAGTWQDAPVDSVEFDDGGWDYAHTFTHREPDSLEKLRDAMKDSMSNEVRVYANRLTALIERGA